MAFQEWPFGDIQLAYLSNGTAKIEILGGSTAEPHATLDSLDGTFGAGRADGRARPQARPSKRRGRSE